MHPMSLTFKSLAIVHLVPALAFQARMKNHDGPKSEHAAGTCKSLGSALTIDNIEFVLRRA
jgi:hypothetical protein